MTQPSARILAVCTGNICRSPVIERLLAARLPGVSVTSAGTHAVVGHAVSAPMVPLLEATGASAEGFAARRLTPQLLAGVDLVLVAALEHRAAVVELAPAVVRRTFTLLELARLVDAAPPAAGSSGIVLPGATTTERLRALPDLAASARGLVTPGDDDVVDPIGRSQAVYQRSFGQMLPAVETIVAALLGR